MHATKVMLGIVTLAIMVSLVVPGLAQEAGKGQKPAMATQEATKVTMDGKTEPHKGREFVSGLPVELKADSRQLHVTVSR